jgi:glycine oxidase
MHMVRALSHPRIAVIGGGIIGLAIAHELARRGASVSLFERGDPGEGASNAAAGMLAAMTESEDAAFGRFVRAAPAAWDRLLGHLKSDDALRATYRRDGTLIAAFGGEAEGLRHMASADSHLRWLTREEALALEPGLSPDITGALLSPQDGHVDNRLAVAALWRACGGHGVALHAREAVAAIETAGGRAKGVRTAAGLHEADWVVLAAGAWCRNMAGLPDEALPPVRPVKGQMLSLAMPDQRLARHVIWGPGVYLVPRTDGQLLVGATVEEAGFDESLSEAAMAGLRRKAAHVLPAADSLHESARWMGFRPGSPDDAPIVGPSHHVDGLMIATGHGRNGILLAPLTAEQVAAGILDGEMPELARAFNPGRFRGAERAVTAPGTN